MLQFFYVMCQRYNLYVCFSACVMDLLCFLRVQPLLNIVYNDMSPS